jgi:hypothetical protein
MNFILKEEKNLEKLKKKIKLENIINLEMEIYGKINI